MKAAFPVRSGTGPRDGDSRVVRARPRVRRRFHNPKSEEARVREVTQMTAISVASLVVAFLRRGEASQVPHSIAREGEGGPQ